MVSFNVYKSTASGAYVEGVCLATDEKPVVGIANGSILFAVDTESGETTRYMYDQNSMSWIEAACPCGGGSGGSSGGGSGGGDSGANVLIAPLEVRMEPGDEFTAVYYKSTKTAAEMLAADLVVFTYDIGDGDASLTVKDFCTHMEMTTGGEYDGYCVFRADNGSISLSCASPSDYPESEGFTPDDPDAPGDAS